ncbi:outer membrane lipoprotein LolB, partial [Francisella tularensis subsp. holarctica]|nr:outer membrane lipoprotein LolB [Francisella tularensis subsp. holarctica]
MSKLKIDTKRRFSLLIALVLIISLSYCATTQTNVTAITTKTVFNQVTTYHNLLKLKKWQANGFIGIIYDNHAESANYTYLQDGDNFSIKLYGPI